jgi:hypothetical protein
MSERSWIDRIGNGLSGLCYRLVSWPGALQAQAVGSIVVSGEEYV